MQWEKMDSPQSIHKANECFGSLDDSIVPTGWDKRSALDLLEEQLSVEHSDVLHY